MVFHDISECIGNTPVINLNHDLVPRGKRLMLKMESYNPGFSIKDRTALGLLQSALASGKLKEGGMVIESTSGNLGKSLAMLGASLKLKVIVVVDPKVDSSVLRWLEAFGAQVDVVREPDENGSYQRARVLRVQELLTQYPEALWPNQYDNEDNVRFHYHTTGDEIAALSVDAVAGCVSTGGHLCGISQRIKTVKLNTTIIACDVEGSAIFGQHFKPYLISGVGLSWRSRNTDLEVLDRVYISSDEEAISACRLLARDCGILLGGSGGLAVCGALAWLKQSDDMSAVAIIPDTGANYLNQIYNSTWLSENGVSLLSKRELEERLRSKRLRSLRATSTQGA